MNFTLFRRPALTVLIAIAILVTIFFLSRSRRHVSPTDSPVGTAPSAAPSSDASTHVAHFEGCLALATTQRCLALDEVIPDGARLSVDASGLALLKLGIGGEVAMNGGTEIALTPSGLQLFRGSIRARGLPAEAELSFEENSRVSCARAGCGFHAVRDPGKDQVWSHRGKLSWRVAGTEPVAISELELATLGKKELALSPRKLPDVTLPVLWIDEEGASIALSRPKSEEQEVPIVVEVSRDQSFQKVDRSPPEEGADVVTLPNLRRTGVHYVRFRAAGVTYPALGVVVRRNSPPAPFQPEQGGASPLGEAVAFSWKDATESKDFDIELASDPDFKSVVKAHRVHEKSEVKLSVPKQLGEAKFFWRVRTGDQSRPKQPWSDVWAFSIVGKAAPVPPPKPVILAAPEFDPDTPEILEVSSDGTLRLKWQPVEGAHSYVITLIDAEKQLLYSKKLAGALGNAALKGIPADRRFNEKGVTLRMVTINADGRRGDAGKVKTVIYRPPTAGAGPQLNSIEVVD